MNTPIDSPVLENLPLERRGVLFPPEVFAHILSMTLVSYALHYTKEMAEDLKKESRTILAASQVCEAWRDVTLGPWCTGIWGTIINVDFNSTLWVKELILRSGSAPLLVQSNPSMCTPPRSFVSEKWQALFAELHRFRKLDLTISRGDICHILPFLLHPAPMLESLALRAAFINPRMGQGLIFFELPPGMHLFRNYSPKLHTGRVTLDNTLCINDRGDFPNLNMVRLNLCFAQAWSFHWTSPIPLSSLDPSTYAARPVMSFPDFEELALTVSTKYCAHLLSRLIIPYTCMVTLSLIQLSQTPSPMSYLFPWLGRYFRGWSSQSPVHFWSLSSAWHGGFAFHAGTKEDLPNRPRFVLEYNAGASTGSVLISFLNFLLEEQIVKDAVGLKLDFEIALDHVIKQSLHDLLSVCKFSTLTLLPKSLEYILPSLLTQDPQITTKYLSHLIIDGPQPESRQLMVDARNLVAEYLFQRFTEKMPSPKLTIHVGETKEFFAWNSKDVVFFAKSVSNLMPKSPVIRRGEFISRYWWSLGRR